MDLGAPILDVQASVVSSTDTSSATKTARPTSIISGGVVTAPGYDPIVINANAGPVEQAESVFVPDIPIMQVNTTNYDYQNKYVNRTDTVTYVNKFKPKGVINIADKEITIIDTNGDTAVIIIAIAVSVLVIIILLLSIRFLYNKMRSEKARAEQIKNTQKNLHKDGQIRVIPRGQGFDTKIRGEEVELDADAQALDPADKAEEHNGEIYEEQYDPNQEFRIFGIGDQTKGGVQSLQ